MAVVAAPAIEYVEDAVTAGSSDEAMETSGEDSDFDEQHDSDRNVDAEALRGEAPKESSSDEDSEREDDALRIHTTSEEAAQQEDAPMAARRGDKGDEEPSSSDSDKEEQATLKQKKEKKKAAGFGSAFAQILRSQPAAAVPVLAGSKSVQKRKQEDAEQLAATKKARKLKRAMKQRGHVAVPRRGEDPQSDAKEKMLQRLATKGVVTLFNAVAKAQKAQKEAELAGPKSKAPKMTTASFLAELKGTANKQEKKGAAKPQAAGGKKDSEDEGPGWDALKPDYGLHGGNKMKDWDKQLDSDSGGEGGFDDGSGGDDGSGSDDEGDW